MRTNYQVSAWFALSVGKTSLTNITLNSTSEYSPFLIFSTGSPLAFSRFFRSIPAAKNYIDNLYLHYPDSTATRPVLDAKQQYLF
jgi:hypothetical protein